MVSNEGFSETEYNEVAEVKYIKSELDNAVFRGKCIKTTLKKTYLS